MLLTVAHQNRFVLTLPSTTCIVSYALCIFLPSIVVFTLTKAAILLPKRQCIVCIIKSFLGRNSGIHSSIVLYPTMMNSFGKYFYRVACILCLLYHVASCMCCYFLLVFCVFLVTAVHEQQSWWCLFFLKRILWVHYVFHSLNVCVQDKIDRFTFNAYANITIIGSSYIEQPAANNNLPDETTVSMFTTYTS